MTQMHSVRMTMKAGGWREVAVVMPNSSSSAQIYAEADRKLREHFGITDTAVDHYVRATWPSKLPAYA